MIVTKETVEFIMVICSNKIKYDCQKMGWECREDMVSLMSCLIAF